MPIYNVRPYIQECIHSILEQMDGQRGIELLLLDDKSTDGSGDVCRRIIDGSTCDARLLHHSENRGISAARNSLLEAAKGDYVWFIDADDTLLPNAVNSLRKIIAEYAPSVILCDYIREGGKSYATFNGPKRSIVRCTETLVSGIFTSRDFHAWSKIFKRVLFEAPIRFPVGACFEDVATVPRALLKAETFYYSGEPWVNYRYRRPGGIMSLVNNKTSFDVKRNDDLAGALGGFSSELTSALPHVTQETQATVARFLSREFVKIAKRRAGGLWRHVSWNEMRTEIWQYRTVMEACSPLPFSANVWHYLRKGNLNRALALGIALTLGRTPK